MVWYNIYKPLPKIAFQQFQVPKFEHQYIEEYTIFKPLLKFAFQQFQAPKFEWALIVGYNIYKPLLKFAFQKFQVPIFEHQCHSRIHHIKTITYICVPAVPSSKISMCIYSMIQHIW